MSDNAYESALAALDFCLANRRREWNATDIRLVTEARDDLAAALSAAPATINVSAIDSRLIGDKAPPLPAHPVSRWTASEEEVIRGWWVKYAGVGGAAAGEECTEPNRDACPRMCMDFCNKAETAAAPTPEVGKAGKVYERCASEMQSLIDEADGLDFDEMTVAALETARDVLREKAQQKDGRHG